MASERIAMNNAVHQLIQLILQGLTWVLRTAEALWDWSWAQINAVFAMPWGHLPAWKMAVGIVVIAALAALVRVRAHRRRVLGDVHDACQSARLCCRRRAVLARIPVDCRQRAGSLLGGAYLIGVPADFPINILACPRRSPACPSTVH
jgi:hypothetical protein